MNKTWERRNNDQKFTDSKTDSAVQQISVIPKRLTDSKRSVQQNDWIWKIHWFEHVPSEQEKREICVIAERFTDFNTSLVNERAVNFSHEKSTVSNSTGI